MSEEKIKHTETCPECGTTCTISWSGLDLVENSGDETLATKVYHPIANESWLKEQEIWKEQNSKLREEKQKAEQSEMWAWEAYNLKAAENRHVQHLECRNEDLTSENSQLKEEYNGTVKMLQDTIAEREELREALQEMLNRYAPYGSGDTDDRKKALEKAETILNDGTKS